MEPAKGAMEVSIADAAMSREILRDITKRPVDVSNLQVHVMHGVVYLQGRIEHLRGYYEDLDLQEELNVIVKLLKQKRGVRDICCEVDFQGPSLKERVRRETRQHIH